MNKVVFQKMIFLLMGMVFCFSAEAASFQCERCFPPDLQVSQLPSCSSTSIRNLLGPEKVGKSEFNNAVFSSLLKNNNLGGIKVHFPDGQTKTIYRSAYLAGAPRCLRDLVKERDVQTVVNLYSKDMGFAKELRPLEEDVFKNNGGKEYVAINAFDVDIKSQKEIDEKIAAIMRTIEIAKGNVLIHCYAGEHDAGVIFGILNKCYNHQSIESIAKDSQCHMKDVTPYGIKRYQLVMNIIQEFPCQML